MLKDSRCFLSIVSLLFSTQTLTEERRRRRTEQLLRTEKSEWGGERWRDGRMRWSTEKRAGERSRAGPASEQAPSLVHVSSWSRICGDTTDQSMTSLPTDKTLLVLFDQTGRVDQLIAAVNQGAKSGTKQILESCQASQIRRTWMKSNQGRWDVCWSKHRLWFQLHWQEIKGTLDSDKWQEAEGFNSEGCWWCGGKSPQEKQTKAFSPLLLLFLVVVIRSHRFIHRKLTTNPQLYPPGETLGQEVLWCLDVSVEPCEAKCGWFTVWFLTHQLLPVSSWSTPLIGYYLYRINSHIGAYRILCPLPVWQYRSSLLENVSLLTLLRVFLTLFVVRYLRSLS